jgi:putative hydrolase of the HAD superfamily
MRPTLIIDADDTLWENEIYYEQCLEAFGDLMAAQGFASDDVSRMVDAVERERVPVAGYAPQEFARNLAIAYERLSLAHGRPVDDGVSRAAWEIGCRVMNHPVDPFEGVEETLQWLRPRFRLLVLTKGDREAQESKLERSGLVHLFEAVHVVREKDAHVLRGLVERYGLEAGSTWMVGNSPRSDINPALEAGIGAVYVPHPSTWNLEQEEIASPERVIKLSRFRELIDLFRGDEDEVCRR